MPYVGNVSLALKERNQLGNKGFNTFFKTSLHKDQNGMKLSERILNYVIKKNIVIKKHIFAMR